MNALAVLVLEQDAQAREMVGRLDPAQFVACPSGTAPDVALCTRPEDIAAIEAAGAPVVAVCADGYAAGRALEGGAADVLLATEADDALITRALRYAAKLGQTRAALAASLDELEQQRSALLTLSTLKSDLIATLAHDIKGPLTSIIGFAELMEEGFLEGADATDAARTIRTNAQRLAALANDILALSRVDSGELEIADDRVSLRDVVQAAIDEAAPERTIETAFDAKTAYIRGDAARLRQVFDNLIRNAIKYSPGGEPVRVELCEDGAKFTVRVIDRGIGVPPGEISKLFQRFGRASNARKSKVAGTGVGLFIVKTIVERHGGTVGVHSDLGAGSTFSVTLPSMEAVKEPSTGRVAIVTGDARLRRFTAYELRARGFRVRELESLDQAAQGQRDGDVMLVDADLGDAAAVRAALGSSHRLIGVGSGDEDGWDAVLAKPFLVGDLVALLGARSLTRQ